MEKEDRDLPVDALLDDLFNRYQAQSKREAGYTGYSFLAVVDIRPRIKKNILIQSPVKKCIKIFFQDDYWVCLLLFQAFIETPSKLNK